MGIPPELGPCDRCGGPPDTVVVSKAGPILVLCNEHLLVHEKALAHSGFFPVEFSDDINEISIEATERR